MNAFSRALLGVALACASCSKSAKELGAAGAQALGRSDFPTAIENFHEAAEQSAPGSDEFVAFKISECEAWCGVNGEQTANDFLALANDYAAKVGQREYVSIISNLSKARQFDAAIKVLDSGRKRFPGNAKLDELGRLLAKAAADTGDDASIEELKKMGYLSK
ncbi:MAG: hypothetical protein K8S98_08220 [Planctomycetes bacterium]|nr:hypothetical protein [Planctomycetota bacterium]